MTAGQIASVFTGIENAPCPVTDRLVKGGFRQISGGYIKYARSVGIGTDHRKAEPHQWWHLMKSYCGRTGSDKVFSRRIVCGELILYMAEVLGCVEEKELEALADRILAEDPELVMNEHSELRKLIKNTDEENDYGSTI